MEPTGADNEFQRKKNKDSDNVERRLIREDGIALDTFQGKNRLSELDLRRRIRHDGAEGVGQHRDQDGKEKSVSQKGKGYHETWS